MLGDGVGPRVAHLLAPRLRVEDGLGIAVSGVVRHDVLSLLLGHLRGAGCGGPLACGEAIMSVTLMEKGHTHQCFRPHPRHL